MRHIAICRRTESRRSRRRFSPRRLISSIPAVCALFAGRIKESACVQCRTHQSCFANNTAAKSDASRDTRFSAKTRDNTRIVRKRGTSQSGKRLSREQMIASPTTKSNATTGYKRLSAISRDATTVEKAKLLSRRDRYTKKHTSIVITGFVSHFAVTLSCFDPLSRRYP